MKTILIILDGVSEENHEKLNNLTPLAYADTPTLNKIIEKGVHKKTIFCPSNRKPESLSCILTMLGVTQESIPRNRAYLEALSASIHIDPNDVVMRCNLISIKNGKLQSFNAEGLSNIEMAQISKQVKTNNSVKFYHMSDYRNLIVIDRSVQLNNTLDYPPHEHVGENIKDMMRDIKKVDQLDQFISDNIIVLGDTEYMFYPWGVSLPLELPTFRELHNKSCICVSKADIVTGIAKAMKISTVKLQNATADVDTDLYEKAKVTLNLENQYDVIITHINGTDEVSHRKDIEGKIKFIEQIDKELLKNIYENISETTQLVIASDHQTSSVTGKHQSGYVDVIMKKNPYKSNS